MQSASRSNAGTLEWEHTGDNGVRKTAVSLSRSRCDKNSGIVQLQVVVVGIQPPLMPEAMLATLIVGLSRVTVRRPRRIWLRHSFVRNGILVLLLRHVVRLRLIGLLPIVVVFWVSEMVRPQVPLLGNIQEERFIQPSEVRRDVVSRNGLLCVVRRLGKMQWGEMASTGMLVWGSR